MKTPFILIALVCGAALLAGCKKAPPAADAAQTTENVDTSAQDAAAQAERDAQAQLAAQQAAQEEQARLQAAEQARLAQEIPLSDVGQAVQRGQYEGAVQTLSQLSTMQSSMSEEDRIRYHQALRATTEALMQAKERDAAAKAAYQRLSRSVLGR
jgi:outer membrane murein-binding lipoprotein Lpp